MLFFLEIVSDFYLFFKLWFFDDDIRIFNKKQIIGHSTKCRVVVIFWSTLLTYTNLRFFKLSHIALISVFGSYPQLLWITLALLIRYSLQTTPPPISWVAPVDKPKCID
jgi:hypothetical protein